MHSRCFCRNEYSKNAFCYNKESVFQTIKKQNKDILFQLIQSHEMTALLEMFLYILTELKYFKCFKIKYYGLWRLKCLTVSISFLLVCF